MSYPHKFFLAMLCVVSSVFGVLPPNPANEPELDPYWKSYFATADEAIEENFWGNLDILRKSALFKDPYIGQLLEMGYCLDEGNEHPARFVDAIGYICDRLNEMVALGVVTEDEILWPGKAYQVGDDYVFIAIGAPVPVGGVALNLLTPDVFVAMLAEGYFPVSEPIREHTNQTLAEHDLAHLAGFVSNPRYMKAVREAFRIVGEKMRTNPRVARALEEFDSLYSLRLYYMIEVFTEVPERSRAELQELIELPLDVPHSREEIIAFLHKKAERPAELYRYLARLYARVHALLNPLGGESRDLLNRRRKYHRDMSFGGFYDGVSALASKFYGNSIYSIYLNARNALENKRSNHDDFARSIDEIHAPVIAALLGTSQLGVEDWVLECVEEVPRKDSKLYRYIHDSGFFDRRHVLYWAYTDEAYDKILVAEDMIPIDSISATAP